METYLVAHVLALREELAEDYSVRHGWLCYHEVNSELRASNIQIDDHCMKSRKASKGHYHIAPMERREPNPQPMPPGGARDGIQDTDILPSPSDMFPSTLMDPSYRTN